MTKLALISFMELFLGNSRILKWIGLVFSWLKTSDISF